MGENVVKMWGEGGGLGRCPTGGHIPACLPTLDKREPHGRRRGSHWALKKSFPSITRGILSPLDAAGGFWANHLNPPQKKPS